MTELIGVNILYSNESSLFQVNNLDLNLGDYVLVRTKQGQEVGVITQDVVLSKNVPNKKYPKVLRVLNKKDMGRYQNILEKEKHYMSKFQNKAREHKLEMKPVNVHVSFDENKILFNFTAEHRIDFRELVKDLANTFKSRIELRQIGVRDETMILGGIGVCGRQFCCTTMKRVPESVSIKMAKDQNLSLNSSKISGACGRLFCCLSYECKSYKKLKKKFPKLGAKITFEGKPSVVKNINILSGEVTVEVNRERVVTVPVNELPLKK
jgi:cell fate regulator YaaT (PSP1 superfamily)